MKGLALALSLTACATAHPTAAAHIDPSIWFKGSVDDAFAAAKVQNKPIFLYWGAVWCPPCNQIKSLVFTTPQFAELMRTVIPVYLDGDTAGAQDWADKLHVSGYPTMLVLDSNGREVMRIGEFVDLETFTAAFTSALITTRPLKDTVGRALSGMATDQDWNVIAYGDWDDLDDAACARLAAVIETASEHDAVRRAIVAGRLLERAATQGASDKSAAVKLLDQLFASEVTVFAARSTVENMSKEIVSWLYPSASMERTALIERWTRAAQPLTTNSKGSVSDRLLGWVPVVELWQLDHVGVAVPATVLSRVQKAVAQADRDASSEYSRHAVISDAAQLLEEAGDVEGARALLLKELQTTDTPWYYQAELAELELKAGHEDAALDWSAKAHQSAKGNATRLQWIAFDLKENLQTSKPDWKKCTVLWHELFDTALALPDGLSGRNATRTRGVIKAMQSHASDAGAVALRPVFDDFVRRCSEHNAQTKCRSFIGAPN